ncbi:MAG: hypothetical protein HC889_06750 [Synechococcaceae cyanobacterium SM1_2_3]|nr:hypothetical protein [Synechococcaceae cyanobacterium SM1_2_3]
MNFKIGHWRGSCWVNFHPITYISILWTSTSFLQYGFFGPELNTGQNLQTPQEFLEFLVEVQCDVAEEVEAVAEEGLEESLKCSGLSLHPLALSLSKGIHW